jgi:Spy/CpxP family protein refolding chaperone
MSVKSFFIGLPVILALTFPAAAAAQPAVVPATHEELSRAIDELAGQIHGLSERWRGHFAGSEPPGERPLLSIMLSHRQELGLSSAQVHELERLRADFQREAIKRDADQRVAEMDLAALLRADPVDIGKVEAKVREIERARVDLRVARIRAIEQGKAQLTPDQRAKLASLLAQPWLPRPRTGQRQAPPSPAATAKPLTQ